MSDNPTTMKQKNFEDIDRIVTKHAFDIQNEFGRYYAERIYRNELAYRCDNDLNIARVEVEHPIHIRYEGFEKFYYIDLLINGIYAYELKVLDSLIPKHSGQLLNYLLIKELHFGKILNFKSKSLGRKFVSSNLLESERKDFEVNDEYWDCENDAENDFKYQVIKLMNTLGLFLSTELYTDLITAVLGGEGAIIQPVEIFNSKQKIGTQKFHLISNATAFKITAITESKRTYVNNIKKMLSHTKLKKIIWVNIDHHELSFMTIKNN